ncbi:MAG: hypothetical protein ACK5Y6_04770 [Pseudomonadota bacterium]|jgi:hypothetical protein
MRIFYTLIGSLLSLGLCCSLVLAESDQGKVALKSFKECVEQGGVLTGKVCKTDSGQIFLQPSEASDSPCVDRCGDGVCQEMVCMAVGCPCAETPESCPKDCAKATE